MLHLGIAQTVIKDPFVPEAMNDGRWSFPVGTGLTAPLWIPLFCVKMIIMRDCRANHG